MAEDIKVVGLTNTKAKGKTNWKVISAIIGIVVLSFGVIAGIFLVRQQQDIREKAGGNCADPQSIVQCPRDDGALVSCTPADENNNAQISLCDSRFIGRVESCGIGNNISQYCCTSSGWSTNMSSCTRTGTPVPTQTPQTSTDTTFSDVPTNHWAYSQIEAIYQAGISTGCSTSPLSYCPERETTRAEMAVFLLKAKNGSSYVPPAATGTVFSDVPTNHWAAPWIEQLSKTGITSGCGNGNYCPEESTTRAEMAVFISKTFGIVTVTTARATATSIATATARATTTTRASATPTSFSNPTATATTSSSATKTPTATATATTSSSATKTPTAKATATATTSGVNLASSSTTPFPVPETGTDLPTVLGVSFGVVMVLVSLGLAL